MDLMLTSFGFGMKKHVEGSPFLQMPPLLMDETTGFFVIDFCSFLMFDRVLLDKASYDWIQNYDYSTDHMRHDWLPRLQKAQKDYGQLLYHLKDRERLVLTDFQSTLESCGSVLEEAVSYDMKNLQEWAAPLEESTEAWSRQWRTAIDAANSGFAKDDQDQQKAISILVHETCHRRGIPYFHIDALKKWKKRQPSDLRKHTREYLREYITYINANIIISRELAVPFIDWEDMHPFYRKKFRISGQQQQTERETVQQARKLFEVMFPYFVPTDLKAIVRAVEDKRIADLRELVAAAVRGDVAFDAEFAANTFREVLKLEHRALLRRKIVGWATLPLGFVPEVGTGLQKAVELGINTVWSNEVKKEIPWFYLMNDLVGDY